MTLHRDMDGQKWDEKKSPFEENGEFGRVVMSGRGRAPTAVA